MTAYRVVAPYVTLTVPGVGGGPELRGFYAGALVADGSDEEQVARLLRKGMLEKVAAEVKAEEPAADAKPAQAASKADWVDYAVTQRADGVSEEDAKAEAEAKTKADLVAEFGG